MSKESFGLQRPAATAGSHGSSGSPLLKIQDSYPNTPAELPTFKLPRASLGDQSRLWCESFGPCFGPRRTLHGVQGHDDGLGGHHGIFEQHQLGSSWDLLLQHRNTFGVCDLTCPADVERLGTVRSSMFVGFGTHGW